MKIDLTQIKNAIKLNKQQDIINELSFIQDCFERGIYNVNVTNLEEVIKFLISNAITCQDDTVLDEILYTLQKSSSQDLSTINFDLLAENINTIKDIKTLMSYIIILGFTCQPKYIPIIEKFENYDDESVQQEVKDALFELEYYKKAKNGK